MPSNNEINSGPGYLVQLKIGKKKGRTYHHIKGVGGCMAVFLEDGKGGYRKEPIQVFPSEFDLLGYAKDKEK